MWRKKKKPKKVIWMISGTAWVDSTIVAYLNQQMRWKFSWFSWNTYRGGRSWQKCSTTPTNLMINFYQALGWEIVCEQSFYKILPDEFGAVYSGVWKDPVQKSFEVSGDWILSPYWIGLFTWEAVLVTKAINVICKVWCDWCTWDPASACRNQLQWRALAQGLWPLTLSSQLRLTLKCSQ